MANSNYRVVIPSSPGDLLNLANSVYKKHQELGASSPLNSMQSNKWDDNGPSVATALGYQEQAEELKRQSEKLNKQRDLLLAPIKESVRASRDLLLGIYRDNPRVLGDWGYEVNSGGTSSTKTDNSATK
ncbi:MAG TPA: hypothetical protein PKH79_13875 [Prolixibacteraceae bacterium]|nr:hypothetical protein [Prolixibacteraceae bacterium]HPS14111.1 hypothetical protein [Prolixibacteraceae bacterium]